MGLLPQFGREPVATMRPLRRRTRSSRNSASSMTWLETAVSCRRQRARGTCSRDRAGGRGRPWARRGRAGPGCPSSAAASGAARRLAAEGCGPSCPHGRRGQRLRSPLSPGRSTHRGWQRNAEDSGGRSGPSRPTGLCDVADAAQKGLRAGELAEDGDLSALDDLHPDDRADRRCLAGSAQAEQAIDDATADVERELRRDSPSPRRTFNLWMWTAGTEFIIC